MPSFSAQWRSVSSVLIAALAVSAWTSAPSAQASVGDDDWSLERKASDPTLVNQRMAKLRRNPFDGAQWRALKRALGLKSLKARITQAQARSPSDPALAILSARADLAAGQPADAANTLRKLASQPNASRWAAKIFNLRIESLHRAGEHRTAVAELETQAAREKSTSAAQGRLRQAFKIADEGRLSSAALRIAHKLAEANPRDHAARLRLARIATRAGKPAVADPAYAQAIATASSRRRAELTAERARARLDGDNPAGAAELLWSLLENRREGATSARAAWWDTLVAAHRRDGSTDVLGAKLSTWLSKHPNEAAAWRTMAALQESGGIDSTRAWKEAVKLDPRDTTSHAALIDAMESKGDTDGAVKELRALLNRSPRSIEPGLDLATRLIRSGKREQGMELAAELTTKAQRSARGLMLLLDFYNLNDEPRTALSVASSLVKLKPRQAEARIALGEQLYQLGETGQALEQWGKLPTLIRPSHKGWARHAAVLSEHGRTAEAVASLKKALKSAPTEPKYLRLAAVLAEEQRRPDRALKLWEEVRRTATAPAQKLLRDEARTRVVELLVGMRPKNDRNWARHAERTSRELLEKGEPLPEAIEAGRFLAELYTRRENYTAAVAVQHQLLKIKPDDPERLEELANAQRRAGQVQSAMGTLEELLDNEPSRSADVLAEMSELAFEAGDSDGALKAATRAAETDRTQVEALVRLGELHERKGDIEAAAEAYGTALSTAPNEPRAKLHLAELELTRGKEEEAAKLFRAVLETSGPPELLREAGRRALDLAEAAQTTMDLLELAVSRTARRPEADEPRLFLLEALDRVDPTALAHWLGAEEHRPVALRRPLVLALSRGSVGARLRAAQHLGKLALPKTAVPLAKLGATLSAPADATATVREAFERTRITALQAAGALADPEAIPVFAAVLQDPSQPLAAQHAAAWALARADSSDATAALIASDRAQRDDVVGVLACSALANHRRGASSLPSRPVSRMNDLIRHSRHAHVRHTCAFGIAAIGSDEDLSDVREALEGSDPVVVAIAAWRLGQVKNPDEATKAALFRRFLGPAGLPRDASAAALARLLRPPSENDQSALSAFPAPTGRNWSTVVERWLEDQIAPPIEPLDPNQLQPHIGAIRAAMASTAKGTRAEQLALERVSRTCGGHSEASSKGPRSRSLCLAPLVSDTIQVGGDAIDK